MTMTTKAMLAILALCTLASCSFREGKPRSEFVQGCRSSGGTEKVCMCSWDGLKEHYGLDRLLEMNETGMLPNDFAEVAVKAKLACSTGASDAALAQLLGSASGTQAPAGTTPAQQSVDATTQHVGQQAAEGQAAADVLQGGNSESKTLALGNHILGIKRKGDTDPFVVALDGNELKRVDAFSLDFMWSSGGVGRPGYALVEINSGGTACPMTYFIVEVAQSGESRLSPEFGSCSDQIISTQEMPWGVEVKMHGFQGPFESPENQAKAAAEIQTYRWDEGHLISPPAANADAAPPSSLKEQAAMLKIGDIGYQPKPGERVMYYASMLKSQKKRMEHCKKFKPLLDAEGLDFQVCLHADKMAG